MIRKIVAVFVIVSIVFASQFFIYSSYVNTSDNIHTEFINVINKMDINNES